MWIFFLALFRLNADAVCEASRGRGEYNDFHDYPDGMYGEPWHFYQHTCSRCKKTFRI